MSPSRFSEGMTSGSPVVAMRSAKVASISCGSYGHLGVPLGRRVHLLLQHSLVDRADGVLRAAEDLGAGSLRGLEGELGDAAADPPLDSLRAKGRLVVPLALAPLLRAVGVADRHPDDEIGACAPPSGMTPGIRRPVRTITRPPTSSRRIRFGDPTSSAPSGVTVAAFRPSPCNLIAVAASNTTWFCVAPPILE